MKTQRKLYNEDIDLCLLSAQMLQISEKYSTGLIKMSQEDREGYYKLLGEFIEIVKVRYPLLSPQ